MNAHPRIDPAARDLANDIMDRLEPLNLTIANARGFRALLEDPRARDLSALQEPHIDAAHMVRAGILRAAISTIMAALDKRGTDRASVGQVVHMFEGMDLSILADRWPDPAFGATTLQQARDDWGTLAQSADFKDCKTFRDRAIAHTLRLEVPTVQTEAYFRLHDAAERLTLRFYRICGFGKPSFVEHQARLTASAKVFWDTYFRGMAAQ